MFYIGLILGFLAGILFLSITACVFAYGEETEEKEDKEREDNV